MTILTKFSIELSPIRKVTMVQATNAFKTWLKATVNMKLSSDAAVTRILHEGITTFESLTDFDESIKKLPTIFKEDIDEIHED